MVKNNNLKISIMKTQKISEIVNARRSYLTASYNYKMGGQTKVVVIRRNSPNVEVTFDDREWCSGRGEKYNKTIKHDFQVKKISLAELRKLDEYLTAQSKEREEKRKAILKIREENGGFLFEEDTKTAWYFDLTFDLAKLAKRLNVTIEAVKLVIEARQGGKTYLRLNETDYLYSPCGCCNELKISRCERDPKGFEWMGGKTLAIV